MNRPTITVYAEVSADGKTTHRRGSSSRDMMSYEDDDVRRFRHQLRATCDAIMVGSNTIRIDDPSLTVRYVPGRNPLRVVPSSDGDLPLDSRILNDGGATLIAVSESASQERVAVLKAAGAEVLQCRGRVVDLESLAAVLFERGIRSMIVEGGETLLAAMFRSRLVDHLIIQHLPVIFGGENVPAMVGGPALDSVSDAVNLRLMAVRRVGRHAVINYDVE